MFNYNNAYSEANQIACRNNGDSSFRTTGCGHYDQKAYNPTIKVICEANGFVLRTVKSLDVKYEILEGGELINRYPSLKIATQFFVDFADITNAKFKKIACLA